MTSQYALVTKECFQINKRNPLEIVANDQWIVMSEIEVTIEVPVEIDQGGDRLSLILCEL